MEQQVVSLKNYLPHRAPMLMVDSITEINPKEVTTSFKIKKQNIFLKNGKFVETGLIENAAQTCAAIVAQPFFVDDKYLLKKNVKLIGFISAIKNLKVHKLPKVDGEIHTQAALGTQFDTGDFVICNMLCHTFDKKELLFEAEINMIIQERKM